MPLIEAYERSVRALSTNLLALAISIPSHVSTTLVGYCVLRALHLQPPLLVFCSLLAIINMLIALPVSLGGVGLRENFFILFFALVNVDKNQATTFSLTFYAITLLWSLVGGLFYFLYRHETHAPAPNASEVNPIFSEP